MQRTENPQKVVQFHPEPLKLLIMTRVFDLSKGDVIYGFCIDTQELEIYQVDNVTLTEINFYTLIGDPYSFYLMFPKELNLEEPVLCKYTEESWWIYSTNFDSLKHLMDVDWDEWPNQHKIFYFDEYLDIWTQTMHKLK